jgi:hypothetical protein
MRRSVVKGLSRIFDLSTEPTALLQPLQNKTPSILRDYAPTENSAGKLSESNAEISCGPVYVLQIRSCSRKVFPQQIVDSVLFHNLSGQIDSSMHRSRSAAEYANLLIENSQVQLKNVNTLNSNSILSQPAASQPASQHASEEIAKMR